MPMKALNSETSGVKYKYFITATNFYTYTYSYSLISHDQWKICHCQ